ncbi:hypothetical protein HPB51_010382 [Rhipicephalus microplus]|uniref:Uncharacterized protein n=1 Tax=Rhipicephalus microplus TaxID=6941 RepID=A0A9J6EG42_RHIMP|nr:hypothetical protein HPB51_010382 [Rhipicephalus microplus]
MPACVCTRVCEDRDVVFCLYGGNPVSVAVASAVLDVIENEKLQQHAMEVGNYLLASLRELQQRHPLIGDVRILG